MPLSRINTNAIANNAVVAADLANTGVTAGTYGSSSNISVVTVNAQGLITSASNVAIPQIVKPSITAPANNATGILDAQLVTASPYFSLYGRSQANAQWQISTSSSFAFINVNSTITGSNTQFQVNSSSGLIENTVHYARVRYSDDANNSSDYSDTVNFTTGVFSFGVDALVVAGGGAGGFAESGGGGAGGLIYRPALSINTGVNYTATVGAGAPSASPDSWGPNGSNSVFSLLTAIGGGGGGTYDSPTPSNLSGRPGGSGGGAGHNPPSSIGTATQTSQPGDSGTYGFGNNGGTGAGVGNNAGSGGGGGAGAVGGNGSTSVGGAGGVGKDYGSTFGPSAPNTAFYAGGGGGGRFDGSGGTGGTGGGGNAPPGPGGGGGAGSPNTGGGGSGGNSSTGGAGGSGVILLRYPTTRTISNPGGGITLTSYPYSGNTVTAITAGTGNISWS